MIDRAPRFFGAVHAKDIDHTWRELTRALRYYSAILGRIVTVPKGFRSDGRSVPRWLFPAFVLYGGRNSPAAWVHDLLYTTGEVPREAADQVFREALRVEFARARELAAAEPPAPTWWGRVRQRVRRAVMPGANALSAHVMYAGVRLGGSSAYRNRPGNQSTAEPFDPSPGA